MRRPGLPSWTLRAVQGAIALGLLVLLWQVAGGEEAAQSLTSANPAWLAAALAALTLQTVLSALRWRLTAAQLGITIDPRAALREYYLSQVVNQSLPGGVLGDAERARRARAQAGFLASGQAVLFERLAGQAGLFLCTATAFILTLALPGGVVWPDWLRAPVAGFVGLGLCLPFGFYAATRLDGRLGRGLRAFGAAMVTALAARSVIVRQLLLSLATTACNLAAFAFCAEAVGHGLPPAAVAAFVPLILLTMLVPLTISGWGLREGAAAALFPVAGASASGGLATSIVFGLMLIVSTLPGLLVLLGRRPDPVGSR
ncbi:Uncharacterized membrane protein YbhN, UPF0104 family [Roseivivax lentus]|uniref:Uncharacterized membrane protein YbhN, UPF0104 family n=1 Tax=Roseivivax lentus TaxID=633194 RepID=A0A1N7PAK0_9RHOB|nr:lysylphosphatidylglycerol synthase transmembrane domain-containing protein [Roseivivax lentus]SIT07578.1 Uncharacterized membrane protein YbhN, UPF0104 family [Roseivivax lentus]